MSALVSGATGWAILPGLPQLPLSTRPTFAQIMAFERHLQSLPQVDCPVNEYREGDQYSRSMLIRKGTFLTGAIHRTRHLCVSVGDIIVWSAGSMKRLKGYNTFVSEAGAKRVGLALEDTIFTTYHVTQETDPDKLIEELCTSTREELLGGRKNVQLNHQRMEQLPCHSE